MAISIKRFGNIAFFVDMFCFLKNVVKSNHKMCENGAP